MEYRVRPNLMKEKRKRGERVRSVLLDILSPDLLEVFGMVGYDAFMLEGEHHAIDENLSQLEWHIVLHEVRLEFG